MNEAEKANAERIVQSIVSVNSDRRAIKEAIEVLEGLTRQDCSVAKKTEEGLRELVVDMIDDWEKWFTRHAATPAEHDEWYRRFEALRP